MTVEQARSYIERLYDEYVSNHIRVQAREELISKINSLDSDVKGYHGREILELLQNADDAYQKSIDGGNKPENVLTVHIKYMNGCLEVMNTGTVFDTDGIKAVVQGNNSPKTGGYIGNKGTGFRSVLNWSDNIEITSGPFGVRFSKEYADAVFKQYESYEQIAKQKRKKPNLYFPILDIPQFKDGHEYVDKTTITVHLDEERIKDDFSVEKQLAEIDLRILLFLPNITEIKIETLSGETLYKRDAQNRGHLEKIVNGEIERVEDYRIFAKTIDSTVEKDKKISLAVAIPLKESEHEVQGLYTYFPLLNTQCPFNCLMHATYSLGSDRNTILRNEANKEIINGQMEFLLEIAQKLPRKDAVALLTPCGFKNSCDLPCMASFDAFNVKEQFFDKLKELKILPTVNGEGISVEDGPKIIDGSFPRLFCGEPFESLLSCELSEGSLRFIKALCEKYRKDTRMSDEKLAQKINILSKNWSPSERVEAFVWWNENKSRATLPELLEHEGGGFVTYGSECYLLEGDFDGVQPPQWVKVPSLKREYQVLLFNAARENPDVRRIKDSGENKSGQISRIISSNNIYATVNFKYRDRSTVIQAVNSSVCGVYDRAVEFVLWLWKHYRKEADWTPPRETYHFPSRDGDVCDSDKMFFGKEYGADREEKLFSDKYSALAKLPIDKDELDDFMAFLELFEVSRFPKIAPCELLATIPSYEGRIKDYISTNHGTDKKKITRIRGEFKYIDGIEDTLKRLTTAEIIWWIQNHGELFATLCKRYEHGGAVSVSYTVRTERTCRISELESYILFIFNETEWISIDGKRVCPRKALRAMRSNQAFSQLVPVISAEQMKDLSEESGVSIPEIERIFDLFDFCERVTDLSSQDFYGLLLDIPERYSVSMGAPLFKSIYGIVENPEFTKEEYEESANKKRYLEQGQLLVMHEGQLKYWRARESFLSSMKIVNKKRLPIVEKGLRTDTKKFARLFGCQKYEKEYEVCGVEESEANEAFGEYMRDFLPYTAPYANANIRKVNLTVTLAKEITLMQNGTTVKLEEEYAVVNEKMSKWYITFFGDELDINKLSLNIESIYATIADSSGFDAGRLGELFRARDRAQREFLIQKDFGDLSVVGKNELKDSFIEIVRGLNEQAQADTFEDIDFQSFSSRETVCQIIERFKKYGIDMHTFMNRGFLYSIDLKGYHNGELRAFIDSRKERYKGYLYEQALNDLDKQEEFWSKYKEFESFKIDYNGRDLVNLDIAKEVEDKFGTEYEFCTVNAEAEYSKNFAKMNPLCKYGDLIANDHRVRTMIFFAKTDDFENWMNKQEVAASTPAPSHDPYAAYRDMTLKITDAVPTGKKGAEKKDKRGGTSKGAYTKTAQELRDKNKKLLGNKGELLVYNTLKAEYGEENVYPKSEAFVELGVILPGQAESGSCDITYTDESGKMVYVEVKAGEPDSFFITPGELEFAMNNKDRYQLYIVTDLNTEEPRGIRVAKCFWENEAYERNDVIERIEFSF